VDLMGILFMVVVPTPLSGNIDLWGHDFPESINVYNEDKHEKQK